MNTVILTGNVCSMFDNNTNIRLTIADNYKDNTDYITVTLFNNQMEFARKYMKVGDHIAIQGRISTYKNNMGYRNPNKNVNSVSGDNNVNNVSKNDFVELGILNIDDEGKLPF